ncbi:group III truncated hemoglobin [Lysobacter humi (ex Lee et al. 2017)]
MPTADPPALTEADIARVVDRFYDAVQAHPTLGSVFVPAVHDWPEHKATLVRFWSSIALKTGSYRGHPMALHRPHPIDAGHFADWLALWTATVQAELPPVHAAQFVEHAQRIARSLMYGLGIDAPKRPLGLPIVGAPAAGARDAN